MHVDLLTSLLLSVSWCRILDKHKGTFCHVENKEVITDYSVSSTLGFWGLDFWNSSLSKFDNLINVSCRPHLI